MGAELHFDACPSRLQPSSVFSSGVYAQATGGTPPVRTAKACTEPRHYELVTLPYLLDQTIEYHNKPSTGKVVTLTPCPLPRQGNRAGEGIFIA
jgi:hypothetical protein